MITEAKLSSHQVDLTKAYDLFKQSYENATGVAWTFDKFIDRAHNWTFYGDDDGYVTVRIQQSGMVKLVGVAGKPKKVITGFREMVNDNANKPIWGTVSLDIAKMIVKLDPKFRILSVPGGVVGKLLFKTIKSVIPASVFGGADVLGVNPDGTIQFNYPDIGAANKVLIGTPEYFDVLKQKVMQLNMPDFAKNQLIKLL